MNRTISTVLVASLFGLLSFASVAEAVIAIGDPGGGGGGSFSVSAGFALNCTAPCSMAANLMVNVSTSNTVAPGSPVYVDISFDGDDYVLNTCPMVKFSADGIASYSTDVISDCWTRAQLTSGVRVANLPTVNAPLTPGNYNLTISVGSTGYNTPAIKTIPYTVVGAAAPVTYMLIGIAGAGGSISPSGITTVNSGASQTYTITPNAGYNIASVSVDGVLQAIASSYTFTAVATNHTISTTFLPTATYGITASASANGVVTPLGTTPVRTGMSQAYTITPNTGYRTSSLTVDGAYQSVAGSYTFSNVTANHSISATFVPVDGAPVVAPAPLGKYPRVRPNTKRSTTPGGRAQLAIDADVHIAPSMSSAVIDTQPSGAIGTVNAADNEIIPAANIRNTWRRVNFDSGIDGWVPGKSLKPAISGKFTADSTAIVKSSQANVRGEPNGPIIGLHKRGEIAEVTGGPVKAGGKVWWPVDYQTGTDGWAAESTIVNAGVPLTLPAPKVYEMTSPLASVPEVASFIAATFDVPVSTLETLQSDAIGSGMVVDGVRTTEFADLGNGVFAYYGEDAAGKTVIVTTDAAGNRVEITKNVGQDGDIKFTFVTPDFQKSEVTMTVFEDIIGVTHVVIYRINEYGEREILEDITSIPEAEVAKILEPLTDEQMKEFTDSLDPDSFVDDQLEFGLIDTGDTIETGVGTVDVNDSDDYSSYGSTYESAFESFGGDWGYGGDVGGGGDWGGGGGGDGGGCFTASTKILMADGSLKNISEIAVGEFVTSSDGPRRVEDVFKRDWTKILYAFNGSGNYFVTGAHPFMTTEGWKSFDLTGTAKENPGLSVTKLELGDNIKMVDGSVTTLSRVDAKYGNTPVYNIQVEGAHNYYADGFLVHNIYAIFKF